MHFLHGRIRGGTSKGMYQDILIRKKTSVLHISQDLSFLSPSHVMHANG